MKLSVGSIRSEQDYTIKVVSVCVKHRFRML